ncbi:MAG: hypothetical protein RSA79_06800, partial [Oscillospiraceae bacterium]
MRARFQRLTLISIIALIGAFLLLGGTIIFAANQVEQVEQTTSSKPPINGTAIFGETENQTSSNVSSNIATDYDYFDAQTGELGIAEILNNLGNNTSSQTDSSKPNSSNSSNKPNTSSKPQTSSTASTKPVVSKPQTSSTQQPSSNPSSQKPVKPSSSTSNDGISNDLLNIISGAVQREIVGTNSPPQPKYYEAYKAQAIACHSYMEYHKKNSGTYPKMSYATPHQKTVELVKEVAHELMYYNGAVINAAYHASSGGYTQSASFIWGGEIPYLSAVESKYDVEQSTYSISSRSLSNKLKANGIITSGEPQTWFDLKNATYTDGSFIKTIEICGQE